MAWKVEEPTEVAESVPSMELTEKYFALVALARQRLDRLFAKEFVFPDPIQLLALRPASEAMAFAETGGQFEKQTESVGDSPYDIEFAIFGNRFSLTARSKSSLYDNSVVQFQLLEGDRVRFAGVLFVREGQGMFEVTLDQIPRPEKERFTISLQPIHNLDLLAKIEDEASLEILAELVKEKDPQIRKACVELLAKAGTKKTRQILEQARNDSDPEIARLVQKVLQGDHPENA